MENFLDSFFETMRTLFLIFITLKCFNLVDMTWVQVFIPFFVTLGVGVIAFIVAFVIVALDLKE